MLERSSPELKRHRSRLQTAQATETSPLNMLRDYITASSNCESSNVFDKPYTRTQLELWATPTTAEMCKCRL
jgi:hypothetical protein